MFVLEIGNIGGLGGDFDASRIASSEAAKAAGAKKKPDSTPNVAARNAQTLGEQVASFFTGSRLSGGAKDDLTNLMQGNDRLASNDKPRNITDA